MITVDFYNFIKDDNSTARPSNADLAAELSCDFLQPFDITGPTVVVNVAAPKAVAFWNYAYISDFSRYYFVENWRYDRGLWYADLRVDVLSTYKDAIGGTSLYILRSSAARNGYIKDTYYPLTGYVSKDSVTAGSVGEAINFSGGRYIVNVAGMNTGTSTLYEMTPANFSLFLDALLGVIDNTTAADVIQAIKNAIFDPLRYITSVMWSPVPFASTTMGRVKVGLWDSGVDAWIITNPTKILIYPALTLPKHPQHSRGKYLDGGPYTTYKLDFEPFGLMELNSAALIDCSAITINVIIDALSGSGILKVFSADVAGDCLASVHTQYCVPLPLLQSSAGSGSISGTIQSIGGVIAGAITGDVGLIGGAVAAGCGSIVDGIKGAVSSIGSGGNIGAFTAWRGLNAVFYHVADADNARNGSPLMQIATPAALGGFMIAQRGDVAISGTSAEADAVRAILERGFYYE